MENTRKIIFLAIGLSFWIFYGWAWTLYADAGYIPQAFTTPSGQVVEALQYSDKYEWREFKTPTGLSIWGIQIITPTEASELPLQEQILNWLNYTAEKYHLNKQIFIGVARCESKDENGDFNPNARGDWRSETKEYMANGLFQFWQRTFEKFKLEAGMDGDYNSWKDQASLAGWAFSNDLAYHWKNCYNWVKRK